MIIRKRAECWMVEGNKIWVGVQKGKIVLPGGTWEKGETIEQTAIRETKEEVGIKPINLKLISNILVVRDNWNGWTHAKTWSYKADFGGYDTKEWGNGPEGKFHRAKIPLDRLYKYFEKMLDREDFMMDVAKQNLRIIRYFKKSI